jgi:hypothetical protein
MRRLVPVLALAVFAAGCGQSSHQVAHFKYEPCKQYPLTCQKAGSGATPQEYEAAAKEYKKMTPQEYETYLKQTGGQ